MHCHGTDLGGASSPKYSSPKLRIVTANPGDEFTQLLRVGVALGGRNLGITGWSTRENLSRLTDDEIAARYTYLYNLPDAARH